MPTCNSCGRARTDEDVLNYDPFQVVTNQPLGWYSADDGELCSECVTKLLRGPRE